MRQLKCICVCLFVRLYMCEKERKNGKDNLDKTSVFVMFNILFMWSKLIQLCHQADQYDVLSANIHQFGMISWIDIISGFCFVLYSAF